MQTEHQSRDLLNADELLAGPPIPARWTKRILNWLIDLFFSYTLVFTFAFGLGIIGELVGLGQTLNQVVLGVGFYGCYIAYYVLFEWLMGKTPGKMVTSTKVIKEDGQKPTLGQAFGRFFARLIPFEVFTMLRERPRGLHDRLPGTWVVDDKPHFFHDRSLINTPD